MIKRDPDDEEDQEVPLDFDLGLPNEIDMLNGYFDYFD